LFKTVVLICYILGATYVLSDSTIL